MLTNGPMFVYKNILHEIMIRILSESNPKYTHTILEGVDK